MFEDYVNQSTSPIIADRRRFLTSMLDHDADPNSKECAMPNCTGEKANGTPFCRGNANHKALVSKHQKEMS